MNQHIHMIAVRYAEQLKPGLTHLAGDCLQCGQKVSLYRR